LSVVYVLLLAVVLIIAALLFVGVAVEVSVNKENGEKLRTDINLFLAGRQIDVAKFVDRRNKQKKDNKDDKKDKENKENEEETDESSLERFTEKLSKLRVNIARGKYTYLLSKRYVRRKIIMDNLELSIVFGLDDAAHTGIVTGVLWGGIYNVFGFVDSLFTVKSHKFNVTPVFEEEGFALSFETRIKCRVINLVLIAFAVLINYIKTGKNL